MTSSSQTSHLTRHNKFSPFRSGRNGQLFRAGRNSFKVRQHETGKFQSQKRRNGTQRTRSPPKRPIQEFCIKAYAVDMDSSLLTVSRSIHRTVSSMRPPIHAVSLSREGRQSYVRQPCIGARRRRLSCFGTFPTHLCSSSIKPQRRQLNILRLFPCY